MNNRTFYNEVLTDHNRYPGHKEKLADANLVLEGVNPSCGDDIVLQLRVEDGRIAEGTFTGDGCAITGFRGYHAGSGHRKDQGRGHAPGGSVLSDD